MSVENKITEVITREINENKELISEETTVHEHKIVYHDEKYYRSKLQMIEKTMKKFWIPASIFFIIFVSSFALVFTIIYSKYVKYAQYRHPKPEFLIEGLQLFLLIAIPITIGIIAYIVYYSILSSQKTNIEYKLLLLKSEEIKEEIKEDFFDSLINLSNNYLDQYYFQTKIQAEKSFKVTLGVSIFGAGIICAGIVMLFLDKTDPAYIATAAGVLSEFIAAVFFYFYNNTIKSMSKYHNKLVLSQNISIALKVVETLPEQEQVQAKMKLCEHLVSEINKYFTLEDK